MNTLLDALPFRDLLLAQASRFEGLKNAFTQPRTQIHSHHIVTSLLALIVVGLLIWLLARRYAYHEQKVLESPLRLFWTLCRAHGLSWGDCGLLLRLSRNQQWSDPARVFLDPEYLNPTSLPPPFRTRAERLRAIRARLFADLDEQPTPFVPLDMTTTREGPPLPAILDLPAWNQDCEPTGSAPSDTLA